MYVREKKARSNCSKSKFQAKIFQGRHQVVFLARGARRSSALGPDRLALGGKLHVYNSKSRYLNKTPKEKADPIQVAFENTGRNLQLTTNKKRGSDVKRERERKVNI